MRCVYSQMRLLQSPSWDHHRGQDVCCKQRRKQSPARTPADCRAERKQTSLSPPMDLCRVHVEYHICSRFLAIHEYNSLLPDWVFRNEQTMSDIIIQCLYDLHNMGDSLRSCCFRMCASSDCLLPDGTPRLCTGDIGNWL